MCSCEKAALLCKNPAFLTLNKGKKSAFYKNISVKKLLSYVRILLFYVKELLSYKTLRTLRFNDATAMRTSLKK